MDLIHILDFAAQLPHPSDLGLVKPSNGLSIVPAIFGLIAFFQVANFFWYAREDNEPKAGWGLDSDAPAFSYRWKQFIGVQILVIIVASSVILAGPEKIFFPLGLR